MKLTAGFMWVIGRFFVGMMLLGMMIWGALAIYYSDLTSATFRTTLSVAFVLGTLAVLFFVRPYRWAVLRRFPGKVIPIRNAKHDNPEQFELG